MQAEKSDRIAPNPHREQIPVRDYRLLTDWAVDNEPGDEMNYKAGFWHQIQFLRDSVASGIFGVRNSNSKFDIDEGGNHVWVIGTHLSKSILLPVVYFYWEGIQFMFRYNFHQWDVTVRSPQALDLPDVDYLFDTKSTTYLGMAGGFPEDFNCDCYGAPEYQITSQFSAALVSQDQVLILCWLIKVARLKQLQEMMLRDDERNDLNTF